MQQVSSRDMNGSSSKHWRHRESSLDCNSRSVLRVSSRIYGAGTKMGQKKDEGRALDIGRVQCGE